MCLSFNCPIIVSRSSARLLRCSAEMKTVLGVLVCQCVRFKKAVTRSILLSSISPSMPTSDPSKKISSTGKRSILLKTRMVGLSPTPISFRIPCTTSICSSKLGCEISTTCNKTSASLTSSKVDLKDSINRVGSLRMKPTVSVNKNGIPSQTTLRTVESTVANNLFSAKTSVLASFCIKVDLPTFVYPTKETRTIRSRFLR